MNLDVFSYNDLIDGQHSNVRLAMESGLLQKGIIGIRGVPEFETKSRAFIKAAREFAALSDAIKQQYALNRYANEYEGYESGIEKFKNAEGVWQVDDKKSGYYACVVGDSINRWPAEVDLKTPYLALGHLIFNTGKLVMDVIGLNASVGLPHDALTIYGRMLHYQNTGQATHANPEWCGRHFDHGIFTGLLPAYYFCDGQEINEPAEAGLFIKPTNGNDFEKIDASDKSVLLFQIGEFGQLASNDRVKATQHLVKKAKGGVERFTLAIFYNAHDQAVIRSTSQLTHDARYQAHQRADGSITYGAWGDASYARYRV